MTLSDSGFLDVGAQKLEYRMIGPRPDAAPTLVLLHEGLGCVDLWGDFPDRLQKATGAGVFVYSRAGYGKSSPVKLPRPLSYMHDEARETLPKLLNAIGFQRGLLVGHSDGASIALVYAANHDVAGISLLAPHVFVEKVTLKAIELTREEFLKGDLRTRLARRHADPDAAFWGWCGVWLDPAFREWTLDAEAKKLTAPNLLIQGVEDPYGSLAQLDRIEALAPCPVQRLHVPGGHNPHLEAAEDTLAAVAAWQSELH